MRFRQVSAEPTVVVEPTRDGPDYRRVCRVHEWASPALPDRDLVPDCPACLLDLDMAKGRLRYRRLQDS